MNKCTALLAVTSALATVCPAAADIKVNDALVSGGNLVISGWTDRANHLVILDDSYSVTADGRGRFRIQHHLFAAELHRHAQGRQRNAARGDRQLRADRPCWAERGGWRGGRPRRRRSARSGGPRRRARSIRRAGPERRYRLRRRARSARRAGHSRRARRGRRGGSTRPGGAAGAARRSRRARTRRASRSEG